MGDLVAENLEESSDVSMKIRAFQILMGTSRVHLSSSSPENESQAATEPVTSTYADHAFESVEVKINRGGRTPCSTHQRCGEKANACEQHRPCEPPKISISTCRPASLYACGLQLLLHFRHIATALKGIVTSFQLVARTQSVLASSIDSRSMSLDLASRSRSRYLPTALRACMPMVSSFSCTLVILRLH